MEEGGGLIVERAEACRQDWRRPNNKKPRGESPSWFVSGARQAQKVRSGGLPALVPNERAPAASLFHSTRVADQSRAVKPPSAICGPLAMASLMVTKKDHHVIQEPFAVLWLLDDLCEVVGRNQISTVDPRFDLQSNLAHDCRADE